MRGLLGLQVGISSVWYEGNPCNMHLLDLAAEVKAGVEEAGLVGFRYNGSAGLRSWRWNVSVSASGPYAPWGTLFALWCP